VLEKNKCYATEGTHKNEFWKAVIPSVWYRGAEFYVSLRGDVEENRYRGSDYSVHVARDFNCHHEQDNAASLRLGFVTGPALACCCTQTVIIIVLGLSST